MDKFPLSGVGAIIAAAGYSQRMGGADKIFTPLGGRPLLSWTIEVFQRCPSIQQIAVVVSERGLEEGRRLLEKEGWSKVVKVCLGGERRQDSVMEGLKGLVDCNWVVIHDGARPLVTVDLIQKGLAEALESGAAVAAVPVKDTIKVAGPYRMVQETLERSRLWSVQTPQVFRFDIIMEGYRRAGDQVTDDASLVERLGYKVKLYHGSYDNIKVSTPEDLALAEVLLRKRTDYAHWIRK